MKRKTHDAREEKRFFHARTTSNMFWTKLMRRVGGCVSDYATVTLCYNSKPEKNIFLALFFFFFFKRRACTLIYEDSDAPSNVTRHNTSLNAPFTRHHSALYEMGTGLALIFYGSISILDTCGLLAVPSDGEIINNSAEKNKKRRNYLKYSQFRVSD